MRQSLSLFELKSMLVIQRWCITFPMDNTVCEFNMGPAQTCLSTFNIESMIMLVI